jgi:hypothetical protein
MPEHDDQAVEFPIMTRWLGIRSWREARKAVAAAIASLAPWLYDVATPGDPVEIVPLLGPVLVLVVTFLVGNDAPPIDQGG